MMIDTFDIVEKADKLRRESKSIIIMRMVQQTTECAWFIRDYMKIKEFCEPLNINFIVYSIFTLAKGNEWRRTLRPVQRIKSKSSSRNLLNCDPLFRQT